MESIQRLRVVLASIATALAAAMGYLVASMPWAPHASFDILGVLWLLSNIPQLIAWGILVALSWLALYAWLEVLRARL